MRVEGEGGGVSHPRGRMGGGDVGVIGKRTVIALMLGLLAATSAHAQSSAGEAAFGVYVIDERLTRDAPEKLRAEILAHLPARWLSLCGWQFHGCKAPIATQDRSEASRTAILDRIEATLSGWAREPYSARESRPILEDLAWAIGNAVRDFDTYAKDEKIDLQFDDESRTGYHVTLITKSDIVLHAGASVTLKGSDIPDACFGIVGGTAPEFPFQPAPSLAKASMDVVVAGDAPETLPPNALRALLVAVGWIGPAATPFGGQKPLGCQSATMADLPKPVDTRGKCPSEIPSVTAPVAPLLCQNKPTEPSRLSQTATAILPAAQQPDPAPSRSISPDPNPDRPPSAAPAAFGGMLVVANAAPAPGSDLPLEVTGDWQDGKARTRLLLAGPGASDAVLASGPGSLLAVAESYRLVLAAKAPPGHYALLIQTRPVPGSCDAAPLSRGRIAVRGGKVAAKDIQIERSITLCGGDTPVTERILDIEVR